MAQYTAEFLAAARQGYEATDQPMRELARALGIGITTLSTLAENHGWAKRSQRKRGLPPAMQLLEEVKALTGETTPSSSRLAALDGAPPDPSPPFAEPVIGPAQEGRTRWLTAGGEQSTPDPAALLTKLEQILAQLIAAQHLAPSNGIQSPQGARTLTMLIQSLRALQGMRAVPVHSGHNDDDDMPTDIDEFRNELARRIDAFVASHTDTKDADANSERADVAATE